MAASNSQNSDRWFHVQLCRWFPSILKVLTIIHPETLVRWHRAGFRSYWRWKSRSLGGRPQIEADLRALIRRMSVDNPRWGAPRIHGELLKLGLEGAQSSVAKYMVKRPGPPSQEWRSFLCNHAPDIAAMDLFVVPTIGFMAVSKWSGWCCPTASRRIFASRKRNGRCRRTTAIHAQTAFRNKRRAYQFGIRWKGISAIAASSAESSTTARSRRSKSSTSEADEGSNLYAD